MRKKFGYQAMAAIFAAAMIVSGAGMYQTTAKAAEGQIRTPQQKTAVETQESAKLKAEAASVDPTEDGEYTLTFEAKQEGSDEESMLAGYFDPKAKLTVENGKMYVTFLNTKLSSFLLDFTVASDGTYKNPVACTSLAKENGNLLVCIPKATNNYLFIDAEWECG